MAGVSERWVWEVTPDGEVRRGVPPEPMLLTGPASRPVEPQATPTGGALVPAAPRRDAVFTVTPGGVVATAAEDLDALVLRGREFAALAQAPATARAYRSDWRAFSAWCERMGLTALPAAPGTVAAYLIAHAETLKVATLARRVASIAVAHRLVGFTLDTRHRDLRPVWQGIRRARGTAQRRVEALTTPRLRQVIATCGDRLLDLRDRALLLVGFAGAFRRSELCALDAADVVVSAEGLTIRLARSKGDQEGEGITVTVGRTSRAMCPARAYEDWVAAAGIGQGRAFRSVDRHGRVGAGLSTRAVALIIQARAAAAGLDAATFSGHSMRAGFATAAAAAGVEEREIARITRHQSMTVLRRYIRTGEQWRRNLSEEVGL